MTVRRLSMLLPALAVAGALGAAEPAPGHCTPRTAQLLAQGTEPVRIVCFGDSITGIYYHTGGRRAWSDMLALALQRLYPNARVEVLNAGASGNTTAAGLALPIHSGMASSPTRRMTYLGMVA